MYVRLALAARLTAVVLFKERPSRTGTHGHHDFAGTGLNLPSRSVVWTALECGDQPDFVPNTVVVFQPIACYVHVFSHVLTSHSKVLHSLTRNNRI